ncbi:adenine specific DNA methylase Mod [Bacteroidales bacterium 6E]|nr:adenine specific DNA methylase Mod [Bacteroidales bacterium 6E]
MIDKLDLRTLNITEAQKGKLKELFPEVFTEGKIDFEKLKLTLGVEIDSSEERFGLTWAGKADCFKVIQEPSVGTLKPCREESINWDTTKNLFIEGDNLEVLKQLQKAYYGKVKMIYIDPPYNTGNEFIYPDKYQENLDTYLAFTGQVDEEGKKFSTNTETTGRFHSNWLNMMYPRLFIARNLLRKDGIIFISIGDHEIDNLRKICNEIFGEDNFITTISRLMKTGGAKGNFFSPNVEFILVYAKNIIEAEYFRSVLSKDQIDRYYKFKEKEGIRKDEIYGEERLYKASLDARPNQRYWIECPDNTFVIPPGKNFPKNIVQGEKVIPTSEDGVWKWIYERFLSEYQLGNIVFKETSTSALLDEHGNKSKWNIYNKVWLKDQEEKGVVPPNYIDKYENRQSSKELKELNIPFDFAKPSGLIKYLIQICGASSNDIVLDFFAGSSSTAHAVLEQNKMGENLRFLMVQLPEPTDEKSEACKAGYKTIADIGKERIRRVIKKIQAELEEKQKQKAGELDFEQEEATDNKLDLGFKVFKLDRSNFKIWDGDVEKKPIEEQLQLNIHRIDPYSCEEDLLYEILLKSGFQPTVPVIKINLAGKTVFSIADDALLICLEKDLTKELIKAVAEKQPIRAVFLDDGFRGNDQLKTNAVQIMKSHDVKEFKTV